MKKVIVILLLFFPLVVNASEQTLGDLKTEYEELLKEQEENNSKTEAAKQDIANKEAAIDDAEANISEAEEQISLAEEEETNLQIEIDESNQKISELEVEVENVLLYLQQMKSSNAYIEYISGASSITDFVMRVAVVEQIADAAQESMESLENEIATNETLVAELQAKETELEAKKASLEALIVTYKAAIEARYDDIEEYDKYALDIDTKVASAKESLDAAITNCEKYAPELGDSAVVSTDCIPKQADGTSVIENDGWLKPVTHGIITSTVGMRWGSYHNALDISGSSYEGTPVYAAAAGVVAAKVVKSSCGGNMLFINVTVDGVNYTTYYYHLLSFNVEVGDVVTQSTIIGYVGGYSTSISHGGYDSCTTGAHLHFGVQTGFYNASTGIVKANVIIPPGFPNIEGWSFYSRDTMY